MKIAHIFTLLAVCMALAFTCGCKSKEAQQSPKQGSSDQRRDDDDDYSGDDDDDDDYSSDDDDDNGTSVSDDDDNDSNDDDDDDDDDSIDDIDWNDLLKPDQLRECKDDDKIYDRKTKDCHKAKIADFSCTKSGIIDHFKSLNVNVESELKRLLDDDYEIDQCGEYKEEPIVLLYKKFYDSGKNEAGIKIKKICLKNSNLCD